MQGRCVYNEHVKSLRVAVVMAALAAVGCNRGAESKEAVRRAIVAHLAERGMNVGSMQVEVVAVTFRGDEADATVSFAAKGVEGQAMTMNYTLARKGDGWSVKSRTEAGGVPHGAAAQAPEGMAMPPGHPPVGADQPGGSQKK